VLIPTQMQIMHFSIVLFSSSYASVSVACTLYTNICTNPLLWLLALKYADAQKLKPAQTLSRPPRPFPFPTLSFFHPPLLFFLSVCLSLGCLICKHACPYTYTFGQALTPRLHMTSIDISNLVAGDGTCLLIDYVYSNAIIRLESRGHETTHYVVGKMRAGIPKADNHLNIVSRYVLYICRICMDT
jgi:hypothetical protein